MKDFPVFTTDSGVASLILREIPYRKCAYVRLQSSLEPKKLLHECIDFCRACGAQTVYAASELLPEEYPVHTSVLEMRGIPNLDMENIRSIFPVTEATVSRWRSLHNEYMQCVDNASTLESRDEARILASGGAYFIHTEGELLGIGWLDEGVLQAIAAVKPGKGIEVATTLLSVCPGEPVTLQVASTNLRAIRLYERLGFVKVRQISRWHEVFPLSRKNT